LTRLGVNNYCKRQYLMETPRVSEAEPTSRSVWWRLVGAATGLSNDAGRTEEEEGEKEERKRDGLVQGWPRYCRGQKAGVI
jgi:hypothetical protein